MSGLNVFSLRSLLLSTLAVTETSSDGKAPCNLMETDPSLSNIAYRYGADRRDPLTQLLFIVALVTTIAWIIKYFYYVHVSLSAPAHIKLAPISTLFLTWVLRCDFIVTHSVAVVADEVISSYCFVCLANFQQLIEVELTRQLSWPLKLQSCLHLLTLNPPG